jgi:hypothetical protein
MTSLVTNAILELVLREGPPLLALGVRGLGAIALFAFAAVVLGLLPRETRRYVRAVLGRQSPVL